MTNVLEFRTKGGQTVVRDQEAINRKIKEQEQAITKTKTASLDFDRTVRQLQMRQETAQQRYNRLLADAKLAFDKNKIGAQEYEKELKDINREMQNSEGRFRKFNETSKQSFGAAAVARFGPFLAGLASVATAQRLITAELTAQKELRSEAEQAKLSTSASRSVLIRNLAGATPDTIAEVQAQNSQLAQRLNVAEKFINLARAEALSASGGDIKASFAAVSGAAKFLFDRPEEIGGFAGSLLDLSKVTGTTDAAVNLGLLTKIGGLSRVVKPSEQAANIPGALIGAKSFGATAGEAGALFATITTETGDLSGRRGGTGLIALTEQLKEFFVEIGRGETSVSERIKILQKDAELRQKFLGDASFEKKVKGPILQLLSDPNSSASVAFAGFLDQFGGGNEALRRGGAEAISNLELNRLRGTFERTQALQSLEERLNLAAPDLLGEAEIERLRKLLIRTGGTALGSRFRTFVGDTVGGISAGEAAEFLVQQQRILRDPKIDPSFAGDRGAIAFKEASEKELRTADLLQKTIEELKNISERQLEEQEKLNAKVTVDGATLTGVPE
jgi:hypothetical protein